MQTFTILLGGQHHTPFPHACYTRKEDRPIEVVSPEQNNSEAGKPFFPPYLSISLSKAKDRMKGSCR
jgi:hypothetical protein